MASKSSSQTETQHLTPALNVPLSIEQCIIKFNNGVALLKSDVEGYDLMLQFLRKSVISVALTKQPSAYYAKYLQEFWLEPSEDIVPLPIKESVKAGLATMGLVDEEDPVISSTTLINTSSMKLKYFSPR
ncbi:hypothetical protein Tco_1132643 [Tanacetum coccineum]|uniref:Uncharacterized protein n=1 Tax=Tanacetum coccineum TaxID=301880 RepID=A0ABQ5JFA0_9ASTR